MTRLTERDWKNKCAGYMWNVHPVKDIDDLPYYKKLAEYEDAEEQGLLLRLPCKVGDTVYGTSSYIDCDEEQCVNINFCECEEDVRCEHLIRKYFVKKINFQIQMLAEFGKTVFLTKEEAEAALAKMESEV